MDGGAAFSGPVVDVAFGPLLLRHRERLGLTVRQLGELADVDHSLVTRLERGQRLPASRGQVMRLAESLGLAGEDADQFFVAGSYAPAWFDVLGTGDLALRAVVDVLTSHRLSSARRQAFRDAVAALGKLVATE